MNTNPCTPTLSLSLIGKLEAERYEASENPHYERFNDGLNFAIAIIKGDAFISKDEGENASRPSGTSPANNHPKEYDEYVPTHEELKQREICYINPQKYNELEQIVFNLLDTKHNGSKTRDKTKAIMQLFSPYLTTGEPDGETRLLHCLNCDVLIDEIERLKKSVSVSLEKCIEATSAAFFLNGTALGIDRKDVVIAVLNAAGVSYVD